MTELAQAPLGTAGLPAVVNSLVARTGGSSSALDLRLTYLRRKPGRGLVAMYRVGHPKPVAPLVHLVVEERALEGARVAVSRDRLERTDSLSGRWPGPIRDAELGITLQAFPADAELPALAAACQPAAGTAVSVALDDARRALGASGSLVTARAEPIRYKPGDRCVIRYVLALSDGTTLGIVGKLYASAGQAGELYRQTHRVYEDQLAEVERPLLPRPLGLVRELGLILTEDLATAGPVVAGTSILRPVGAVVQPPVTAIESAAAALARLHSGAFRPQSIRSPTTEASRARKRALRVADFVPQLGERAARLADRVEERLELSTATPSVPAHGSFKSAQLVFRDGQVLITDFDQFCTADPALDVGYFLAYLRPQSLWYGRHAARNWFEAAARAFLSAYGRATAARGEATRNVEATASRSRAYQAAVLFKIANRRFNRLQSPRPGELGAILDEIESCVDGEA
jgi:Phosphotransferase enzyme family